MGVLLRRCGVRSREPIKAEQRQLQALLVWVDLKRAPRDPDGSLVVARFDVSIRRVLDRLEISDMQRVAIGNRPLLVREVKAEPALVSVAQLTDGRRRRIGAQ